MGSPQQPTAEQYARLGVAGHLQLLGSPEWMGTKDAKLELLFDLPRQGISLVKVSW